MFWLVLGIIIFIAGIIALSTGKSFMKKYSSDTHDYRFGKCMRMISIPILILGLIAALCSTMTTIPTGYTGILTTFGKVSNNTLDAGLNFKAPWQSVIKMDNREQKAAFEVQAFSSDIQQVQVIGSINYSINQATAMTLYKEVGTKYVDILVTPRLLENVKAVFSRYSAEELVGMREVLSKEIVALMAEDIGADGINVISIAIEDIDFTDAFTNAIEEKQVATQNKLKAETEQAQKILEAEAEAERKKIEADAAAEVRRIEADAIAYETLTKAEAEAEANRLLAESLTPEILEKLYFDNWNGALPHVVGESGSYILPSNYIE